MTVSRAFNVARFLIAGILAIYLVDVNLKRSLGVDSAWRFISGLPDFFGANKPLDRNPFTDEPYWETKYVDGNVAHRPYPHYWPVDEMLDLVAKNFEDSFLPKVYRLASVTNYEWMTGDYFHYKIWQKALNKRLKFKLAIPPPKDKSPLEIVKEYDFLVIKTGKVLKNDFYGIPWADRSQAFVDALTANDYKTLREGDFVMLGRFDLPDGSEATVWKSGKMTASTSLLDAMGASEWSVRQSGSARTSVFDIGGDSRRVLYHHPIAPPRVSEVRWHDIPIVAGTMFSFGVALHQGVWTETGGDGVKFAVDIIAEGKRSTLFSRHIDPINRPDHRRWFDFRIPLDAYAGKSVSLVLRTTPGADGNTAFDQAGWSGLRLSIER